jgi:hypothetical protein
MRRNTPFGRMVAAVFLAGFLFGLFSARAFSWNPTDDTNVNSRYTVESVEITGASETRLSRGLRDDLRRYVGQRFSPEAFAKLSSRVREELKARLVSPKLMRGSAPESVRVVLDVLGRRISVSTEQSRLAWLSRQGWTGELALTVEERDRQRLVLSGFSDGDTLTERLSGARLSYSRSFLNGRLRPGISVSTARASYDARTLRAAGPNELYRNASRFQPTVTFVPWILDERDELTVETGIRLQRFDLLSPESNRNVASYALVNTLRYRRVRGDIENGRTAWTGLFALANGAGGDYSFARQELRAGAEFQRGPHRLTLDAAAGSLRGNAPFAERFAAGNTQLLRGWNKFEIAPLGGTRLLASSAEFGRSLKGKLELSAFVDSGSIWNAGAKATARTSAGCGLRTRDGFFFYLAFPLREGRVEPMVMTGATF